MSKKKKLYKLIILDENKEAIKIINTEDPKLIALHTEGLDEKDYKIIRL